jgi:hypothetical protein
MPHLGIRDFNYGGNVMKMIKNFVNWYVHAFIKAYNNDTYRSLYSYYMSVITQA